jgi:excisionase family DNA binding protein
LTVHSASKRKSPTDGDLGEYLAGPGIFIRRAVPNATQKVSPRTGGCVKMTDHQTLLRVPDVAARLDVSEDLVRRLIKTKELPVVQLGRIQRVVPAELDAFLARGGARLDYDPEQER